jgi:hypothetical protein
MKVAIPREALENSYGNLFGDILSPVAHVLQEAHKTVEDID